MAEHQTTKQTPENDQITIRAIHDLARIGLSPVQIADALNLPASTADRVLKGGELRPADFIPNKGRF